MIGDKLIGFIEQSSKFLKGVYPGDTLYPEFTITELIPQRTTGIVVMASTIHNQNGDLVLTGEHKYLLQIAHDPEKWTPVFGQDHAPRIASRLRPELRNKRRKSCPSFPESARSLRS